MGGEPATRPRLFPAAATRSHPQSQHLHTCQGLITGLSARAAHAISRFQSHFSDYSAPGQRGAAPAHTPGAQSPLRGCGRLPAPRRGWASRRAQTRLPPTAPPIWSLPAPPALGRRLVPPGRTYAIHPQGAPSTQRVADPFLPGSGHVLAVAHVGFWVHSSRSSV